MKTAMKTAALTLALVAVWPGRTIAQSTGSLGRPEPSWSMQVGAGIGGLVKSYGQETGALRAGLISLRRMTAGTMALRLDGWFVERKPGQFADSFYSFDRKSNAGIFLRRSDTRFFAATVAGAFPLRLTPDISLEPIVGIGVVPFARGTFVGQADTGGQTVQPFSQTSRGVVVPLGVSLRLWRFSIEQHALTVFGADRALANGENAPLTISYRVIPW